MDDERRVRVLKRDNQKRPIEAAVTVPTRPGLEVVAAKGPVNWYATCALRDGEEISLPRCFLLNDESLRALETLI